MSMNVFKSSSLVDPAARRAVMGQSGGVVWFTGLSGSGKSTLAKSLEKTLIDLKRPAFLLDGDNLRQGLCSDLGFAQVDREENVRRAAAVAALMADAGLICITAFISPLRAMRAAARAMIGGHRFLEIHVCTPIEVCEQRDCKGLYKRARSGELPDFTGVSAPYEPPIAPDLEIDTSQESNARSMERLLDLLAQRGF